MTEKKLSRVLIMAGGTGGHVFPGLALAACLKARGVQVHWLGTPFGLESDLVPKANINFHPLIIKGIRGKGWRTLLAAPFKVIQATWAAYWEIKKIKPDAVIGMGGYVSGPGGVASWLLQYPLFIHEQNAKAGMTNKLLARLSTRVLEAFPKTFKASHRVVTTGNPVRVEIENLTPPIDRFQSRYAPFRLLVLGGSLGAQALNEQLPKALALLKPDERPLIIHQTGNKTFIETKTIYETLNVLSPEIQLHSFINDMSEVYAWADLVLCRAGALTIAELCGAGIGAILVPYPYAVDDHQTANALFMVNKNAALCIQQKELTPQKLADLIKSFSISQDQCLKMAKAAYSLRKVSVAEKIYAVMAQATNAAH
ncbi:MAG: undecaprenyldiphospho-muramoylpentapeptide beta-N-acetylglucosaminyltransferase [Gammaproteobacteria bacterium]|nr:undecaprenyldiphospho-muramoylpentapeptide beta-N-acetylglucosaminyltransferase [Gammaproteobacteria bacterium]